MKTSQKNDELKKFKKGGSTNRVLMIVMINILFYNVSNVFSFWVWCCDIHYNFCMETMFGPFLPPVVGRRAHFLFIDWLTCVNLIDHYQHKSIKKKEKKVYCMVFISNLAVFQLYRGVIRKHRVIISNNISFLPGYRYFTHAFDVCHLKLFVGVKFHSHIVHDM